MSSLLLGASVSRSNIVTSWVYDALYTIDGLFHASDSPQKHAPQITAVTSDPQVFIEKNCVDHAISATAAGNMWYIGDNISIVSAAEGSGFVSEKLLRNRETLQKISELKSNWNGYGANGFSNSLINRCKSFIEEIGFQPDIFPTANDSIQFEWKNPQGDYLEIEFYEDGSYGAYYESIDGSWKEWDMKLSEVSEQVESLFTKGTLS